VRCREHCRLAAALEDEQKERVHAASQQLTNSKNAKAKWNKFAANSINGTATLADTKHSERAARHWPPKPSKHYLATDVDAAAVVRQRLASAPPLISGDRRKAPPRRLKEKLERAAARAVAMARALKAADGNVRLLRSEDATDAKPAAAAAAASAVPAVAHAQAAPVQRAAAVLAPEPAAVVHTTANRFQALTDSPEPTVAVKIARSVVVAPLVLSPSVAVAA